MNHQESGTPKKNWLEMATNVAVLLAAVALVVKLGANEWPRSKPRTEVPIPSEPLDLASGQVIGDASSRVAMIMYSDFECPYCAAFAKNTLPRIRDAYVTNGSVKIVFRHLPLVQIHKFAQKAAEAADCAGAQGKFLAMHDVLFADQLRLSVDSLQSHARGLGLQEVAFQQCMDGPAEKRVTAERLAGESLHLTGTPSFLIGRVLDDGRLRVSKVMFGAQTLDDFKAVLDPLVAGK